MLVKRLEVEGKEAVSEIIQCMDDYFLTKDDWDAIIELGVGPMDEKAVNIPGPTKSAFTRMYNQMSHPMPFMKASSVATTKATKKEAPDFESAIAESEDEMAGAADVDKAEADEADITKDKYVKQPKKESASKKATASKKKAATSGVKAKTTKTIKGKAGTSAKRGRGQKTA